MSINGSLEVILLYGGDEEEKYKVGVGWTLWYVVKECTENIEIKK